MGHTVKDKISGKFIIIPMDALFSVRGLLKSAA